MNLRSLHSSPPEVIRFSVSSRASAHLTHSRLRPRAPRTVPASSDVSSPPHSALFTYCARCWGVGRQCQVRGELPRQMQRGAVRRDAAVHTDGPGWLRLLSGLRSRQRGALLPHSVGDARGEVRTRIILRVLQRWRRLWRWIWNLQRYVHIKYPFFSLAAIFLHAAFLNWCSAAPNPVSYYVITVFQDTFQSLP